MGIRTSSASLSSFPSLIRSWCSYSHFASVILILCFLSRLSAEESPVKDKYDCSFKDSKGNIIDLSKLSKSDGRPWEVPDLRPGRSDLFYDLHLCRRFQNYSGSACDGQASSCQRILGNDGSVTYKNLGLPDGPPFRYADNSVRLFYSNGTFCHRSQRHRSTSIEFICDPTSDEQEGPVFVDETSGCTYKFTWRTKAVCPKSYASTVPCVLHDPINELTYDLGGLRRSRRNWVTPVDDGSNRKVHINFCDSLVSLPQGAEANCSESGACLVQNDNYGTVITAVSLGKPKSPEFERGNGSGIIFHYSSTSNSSSASCGISIRMLCSPPEEANPAPIFLWQFGCLTFMMLSVPEACPVAKKPEIVTDDCSIEFEGEEIDLGRLKNAGNHHDGSYLVRADDYDYLINVCEPVKAGCADDAGGCQIERHGNKRSFSTGRFSRELRRLPGDVIELKYDSGSPCLNGAFNRTTIIYFFCDNHISVSESKPIFIDEHDECNYEFHWRTPLACRQSKMLECSVEVPSPTKFYVHHVDRVDLKKLALVKGNHEGLADNIHLLNQFVINVCRPVHSTKDRKCPPGSGVCMPAVWQPEPQNLGFPDSEPEFIMTKRATVNTPAEGYISLKYSNGDLCPFRNESVSNGSKPMRLSSEIHFTCLPGSEVGSPRLVNDDKVRCHYVFEWATNAACPPDAEVNEKTCSVHFADADHTFDLTQVPKSANGDLEAKYERQSGTVVHWNICDNVGHLNGSEVESDPCENSAICAIKSDGTRVSYGSADQMRLRRDESAIKLEYRGGSNCTEHWLSSYGTLSKAYSRIRLECDHHETRTYIFLMTSCYAIMHHRSPFFCPPVTEKCFLTSNKSFYDLRQLSTQEGESWRVDGKDASYRLNVCGNINGVGGCDAESAVCKLPKEGSSVLADTPWSHSSASTQRLEMIRGDNETSYLQLNYFGAMNCPNRTKNGGFYTTQIRFLCGAHLGNPVLVEENLDDCLLLFEWKSRVACSVKKQKVEVDKNGLIHDPVTERQMNVSTLLHPETDVQLAVEDRSSGERYVYFIRLGGHIHFNTEAKHDNWRKCINASVCQTKQDASFFRDIGTSGSLDLHMEDGQLEAVLQGGRCGRVPGRSAWSIIRFHCDLMEHVPEFIYESASCDYVFSWKTPHVCLRYSSSATQPPSITNTPTAKGAEPTTSTADPPIATGETTVSNDPTKTPSSAITTPAITSPLTPVVASTFGPGLPAGNGSDTAAKGDRGQAVNNKPGAIVVAILILIAILMFVVFYVASPRFRGKVLSMGQKIRRSGSPFSDRSPQRGFEPIADDSFVYDATDMNIKGARGSTYGAQSSTPPRSLSDDPSYNLANEFNDQTERDDAFLVT